MSQRDENILDVVVVGAGIQGAGVAQAAVAEGWSTLVLEKAEKPACGTSSKSSKLIHGGLRYLETMQFKLVRDCLKEKKRLCELAPDLVKPARFIIPVYSHFQRAPIWIQLGLYLYKLLGWPSLNPVRGKCSKQSWGEHVSLEKDGLQAVFEYEDAQTDDASLTEAVLASAKSLGAAVRFDVQISAITKTASSGKTIYALALNNGEQIFTRSIVNATGPWVNKFAQLFEDCRVPAMQVDLVQGAHIVLNRPALSCCYYVESPDDGRAMFVLPWKGKIMVGTTESHFEGEPEDCAATPEEVSYLLKAFNRYFPALHAEHADIVEQFAGLRVLPVADSSENKRSRDTVLVCSDSMPGYLAIYGGKLTAYRSSAEKVISRLARHLPKKAKIADTRELHLVAVR